MISTHTYLENPSLNPHISLLITSSHILHHYKVLDAYGHISLRNPLNPNTFFLPRNLAPALISSPSDIVEYSVETGEAVNWDRSAHRKGEIEFDTQTDTPPKGYAERYIHSEIYRKWQGVNAVVHSHDPEVAVWALMRRKSGLETGKAHGVYDGTEKGKEEEKAGLRAVSHMAGFLRSDGVPIWDIAHDYSKRSATSSEDPKSRRQVQNMLVLDQGLGASLAEAFGSTSTPTSTAGSENEGEVGVDAINPSIPLHRIILMRGHGYTAIAESIKLAVYECIFTQMNAKMQREAVGLARSVGGVGGEQAEGVGVGGGSGPGIGYEMVALSEEEAKGAWQFNVNTAERPWGLWEREAEVNPLYRNELKDALAAGKKIRILSQIQVE